MFVNFDLPAPLERAPVVLTAQAGQAAFAPPTGLPKLVATAGPKRAIDDQRPMVPLHGVRVPEKGKPLVDPATGFEVMRLSDAAEIARASGGRPTTYSGIVYARHTAANVKGDMVLVNAQDGSTAIYRPDGSLLTVLRFRPSKLNSRSFADYNELRWDYTGQHPYRLYFVGRGLPASLALHRERVGMSFYRVDVDPNTGRQAEPVLIRDFSQDFPDFPDAEIMNDVEGDSSIDSSRWAWMVMNTSLSSGHRPYAIFTYDMGSDRILGTLQRKCQPFAPKPCVVIDTPAQPLPYLSRPNMVEFSPLGTRVVVHWDRAQPGKHEANLGTTADGPRAFLPNFSDAIRIAVDSTHSGWAWGWGGEELFVSQNNTNDYLEAVDVASARTARCTPLPKKINAWTCGVKVQHAKEVDPNWEMGMHIGKVYDRSKRGWIPMFTFGKHNRHWSLNQILMIEVNDGTRRKSRVVRMGSTYNMHHDYHSEGHGGMDFTGDSFYLTANWGHKDGRGEAIRITPPKGWWQSLPK